MSRRNLATLFQKAFHTLTGDKPIHPVDRRMAKEWVKKRLLVVFPELRGKPRELEEAYRDLGLEPRNGGAGEPETVFEMTLPRQ